MTLEGEGEPSISSSREEVAVLLDYPRANLGDDVGADGKEFGQGVADLACDINPGGDGLHLQPGSGPGQWLTVSPRMVAARAAARRRQRGSTGGDQAPGNSGTAPGRGPDS